MILDTVYKFSVLVAPSLIPGAGMGAHLTYEGAMRLKSTWKDHGQEKEEIPPRSSTGSVDDNFDEPLEALCPSGEKIAIKLTGQILERQADPSSRPPIEVYEDVVGISFPDRLANKLIDLGCYGPLLSSDRKTESLYLVKNFLFSNRRKLV